MAKLKILTQPNELLLKKSKEVTEFNDRLHQLIDDMVDTVDAAGGAGLAAVQVGVLYRVTVLYDMDGEIIELVNPVITKATKFVEGEEGCLSCPDVHATINRAHNVTVKAQDRFGKDFIVNLNGISAVCAQHEIDHMDGILIGGKR